MITTEAHELLWTYTAAEREDVLPGTFAIQAPGGRPCDCWPGAAVACAVLSGWLHDASTRAELDEAIRHGATLLEMDVVSVDDWREETGRVIAEAMADIERRGGVWN
jgi:hypothetical protein